MGLNLATLVYSTLSLQKLTDGTRLFPSQVLHAARNNGRQGRQRVAHGRRAASGVQVHTRTAVEARACARREVSQSLTKTKIFYWFIMSKKFR